MAPLRSARYVSLVVLVAASYFIAGKIGLSLASINASATPVWPPTGIALATLVLGPALWPGVFIGAFLANLTTAGTIWTSLAVAAGNTLEGVIGAWLVRTFASGERVLERPTHLFRFAFLAGGLGTMVSATVGVTSLGLAGFVPESAISGTWLTW